MGIKEWQLIMKNLSKILIILLCFTFVFSLVGCGAENANGANGNTQINGETTYTFSVNATEITFEVGETFQIVAGYGKEQINYSVEQAEVATVSETGLVTAVKVGTTYVNIVAGEEKRICKVNVVANEYTIEISASERNMYVGTVLTFTATTYKNGEEYNGNVTWSVTDGATIKADADKVTFTATAKGTYTLTATSEKGATDTCVITVVEALSDF